MYANSVERRGDDEKLMANLGGAPRPPSPTLTKEAAAHHPSSREQALPILNYCAASIMMTVVNKVRTQLSGTAAEQWLWCSCGGDLGLVAGGASLFAAHGFTVSHRLQCVARRWTRCWRPVSPLRCADGNERDMPCPRRRHKQCPDCVVVM